MTDTAEATHYHRLQLRLAVGRLALTAAFFFAVLASGAAHRVAEAAARLTAAPALQVAIVASRSESLMPCSDCPSRGSAAFTGRAASACSISRCGAGLSTAQKLPRSAAW
jgi:hypothetical protein